MNKAHIDFKSSLNFEGCMHETNTVCHDAEMQGN